MSTLHFVLLIFAITASFANAQDKWVWSKGKNQKVLGYYPAADKKVYYADELNARADRDREPTTKRPLPGQPANDDIDDYNDETETPPSKQNSPYLPGDLGNPGGFGGQYGGGGIGGFNQYPQFGGGAGGPYPNNPNPNGILVGPGGPTGIIGRPQSQYPVGAYPGQVGYPGYPSYNTAPSYAGSVNSGFPGYNGLGQYPGPQPSYPNPHQQFAAGPQYTAPHFTEGYGLSAFPQAGGYQPNPQQNFNGYPAYPNYSGYQGFDEQVPPQVEGKSARVKTNNKKIDDKVNKNLKNS